MLLSTQAGNLYKSFGEETTLKMMAEAGFKGLDYSITQNMVPWNEEFFTKPLTAEFKVHFEDIEKRTASYGIKIIQTHSPYRRPFQCDSEGYKMVLEQSICAIYATAYLGAPYIVAHPVAHPDFDNGANRDKGIDANIRYFEKLVPTLKDTGVVMCIENLYRGELDKPKIANACSSAADLCEVIDTLNSKYGPCFAACLDTGHALISGNEPVSMLKELGCRVRALHIHDSRGIYDDHQIPGRGIAKWAEFMAMLREVDYKGYLNFEVDTYFEDLIQPYYDESVMQDALKLLYTTGISLINSANK